MKTEENNWAKILLSWVEQLELEKYQTDQVVERSKSQEVADNKFSS